MAEFDGGHAGLFATTRAGLSVLLSYGDALRRSPFSPSRVTFPIVVIFCFSGVSFSIFSELITTRAVGTSLPGGRRK